MLSIVMEDWKTVDDSSKKYFPSLNTEKCEQFTGETECTLCSDRRLIIALFCVRSVQLAAVSGQRTGSFTENFK